jgi:hypothetical protein
MIRALAAKRMAPGGRPDKGLNNGIVDMVDRRDLVSEKLNHRKKGQQANHPPAGQPIPGRAEFNQVGESGCQRHNQKGM